MTKPETNSTPTDTQGDSGESSGLRSSILHKISSPNIKPPEIKINNNNFFEN